MEPKNLPFGGTTENYPSTKVEYRLPVVEDYPGVRFELDLSIKYVEQPLNPEIDIWMNGTTVSNIFKL